MKDIIKVIICIVIIVVSFGLSDFVFAQSAQEIATEGLKTTANQAQLQAGDPIKTIGSILSVILGLLGVVLVIIIIYAGVMWMTAGGKSDQVTKAKDMIINAVIGLIIALVAFSLTRYVVERITGALNTQASNLYENVQDKKI
jgi:sterol desaturase/sphingolipid hydroxylase (fatty acid hydroxylase superfamily)